MSNFIVNTDIPNLRVVIREGDDYNVNIVPGRISTLITGSFTTYADLAGNADTASYALFAETLVGTIESASYALDAEHLDGKDSSIFATTGSNIFVGEQIITGSVISNEFKLNAGEVSVTFTGSVNTGIFGVSEYIEPFISTQSYSGASIEYVAQRPGATRMGIIMATWAAGSTLVFTDISTADVGDTSDISFIFLPSGSYYRLRVNSGGTGSGTWTVQSLFKLFPNLGS